MSAVPAQPLPLVLVPGLNNTPAIWDDVLPRLAPGITVHAPLVPARDTVEAIAEELLAQLPERFALCGFSFGGYVALAMLEIGRAHV